MNEFGTPMGFESEAMLPPGQNKPHQRLMAESGLEMSLDAGTAMLIGSAVGVVGGIIGGSKSASAARQAAKQQNEAAARQLGYDTELWEMSKEKIHADRDHAIQEIETQKRNEQRTAEVQDASNLKKYNYDMMIRNREQYSLNEQFAKSNRIYGEQLDFNQVAAGAGADDQIRQLEEARYEAAFDQQELNIESIIAEGKARAKGMAGRSARKYQQALNADVGLQLAMISQSLAGEERNTRSVLGEINRDWRAADIAAEAQRMLNPGELPLPIVPYQTPMAEWIMPREIGEFDFGPRPVMGAMASPSAAANMAWGTAITGIAGNVSAGFGAYAGTKA